MKTSRIRQGLSLVLSLALAASFGLSAAAAETDGLCPHHPVHTAECGYEAAGACTHECTEDSGCITVSCAHVHVATCYDGEHDLICTHACTENPPCYTPALSCVHTEHGSCGYSEGRDCSFAAEGCPDCEAAGEEPAEPSEPVQPTEPSRPEEDGEETGPFDYQIVKGSGGKWYQESGKNLSFVLNTDAGAVTAVCINGRVLEKAHYTLTGSTIILKESWLAEQNIGEYGIRVEFEDGAAAGTFRIAGALDPTNPKTGDTIGIRLGILGLSLAAAVALLILGRKKFFK